MTIIVDFELGHDTIRFESSYDELESRIHVVGEDTVIAYGPNDANSITLKNIAANLSLRSFDFVVS